MATKFITIRIPIPNLRIARIEKKKDSYVTSDDFAVRLLEIQSRIASLKSRFGWTEKSNKSIKVQSEPVVVQQEQLSDEVIARQRKEAELNDLKAKLLAKR